MLTRAACYVDIVYAAATEHRTNTQNENDCILAYDNVEN